jgi:hypothetical protein
MTANNWNFRYKIVDGAEAIEVKPPAHVDRGAKDAVVDFIWAELGHNRLEGLNDYRKIWDSVTMEPNVEARGITGNGTAQTLEGDEVVIESLYDQWEPVRMSSREFEEFLSQLADFLKNSEE